MKIAIVTPEFVSETDFDGGLANYTHRLAKSLIQLGHKPVVFVKSFENTKIIFDGIEVQRVDMEKYDEWIYSNKYLCKPYSIAKRLFYRRTPWRNLEIKHGLKIQSSQLNKQLKQIHKEQHFDIIHYAHLGGVGYCRPKDIPCVARLSSSTSLCQQFGGYGAPDKEIMYQEKLEFKALKKMDGIFGPSRMIASITEKEINRKIEIIETPYIEESAALDNSLYEQHLKGKKYLLFFGSIGLIKGSGTIAEIIYELLQQNPDLYFVLVGKSLHSSDPSMNMVQYIKHRAKEHANRVIHFDKTPHSQLYPIISNSLFCVLPSRMDNFPNTCIEAMAHSKIVIGTLGNGFEQLIDQGKSGFLIKVDDHKQLLETINKTLALSPEEKQVIEKNALKRIELLKPEKVVVQLLEFYKKTIENFS